MINIRHGNESSTFSYVFMVGFVAMQLTHPTAASDHSDRHFLPQAYYSEGNKPTFNNSANPITGEYILSLNGFEKSVSDFYARLLTSQEPLGAQYEKVLYDNLWDLYES